MRLASFVLLMAMPHASVAAQDTMPATSRVTTPPSRTAPDSGFLMQVHGNVNVPAGERQGVVIVARGDARLGGHVTALMVIEGDAIIDGGTVGDLSVVRGAARLLNGAVVTGDVHLVDAAIDVSPDSRVAGTIDRGMRSRLSTGLVGFTALLGLGVLAAMVLGGIIAAMIAPDQVTATGSLMRAEAGRAALTACVVWIALPIVAVLLLPSIIGLPIGLGYFVFVLPMLGFLGLIVAGTWLGDQLLRSMRGDRTATGIVAAAALGILIILVLGRIPVIGFLASLLVMLASGAVVLRAVRVMKRNRRTAEI